MSIIGAPKLSRKFSDRAKWAILKADTRTATMNHNTEWITDTGDSLFSMIQSAVEAAPIVVPVVQGVAVGADGVAAGSVPLTAQQKSMAASATKTLPTRSKISTNLDDYDVAELRKDLTTAKGGSIKVRMNVERAKYLQASFGLQWNSAADMGVESAEDLRDMQNAALSTYLHTKSIQFIEMI